MKLSSIILENNSVNIKLNKEELSKITSLVLDDYKNLSLEEAQSSAEIQEEILANVSFYSTIKEGVKADKKLREAAATGISWLDAAIDIFGSVKNLLTSTSLGEWLVNKVKKFVDRFFPKIGKDPNSNINKVVKFAHKIAKALSPKGIAWTIAAFKNKTLKPSKEQIQKHMDISTKVYQGLMLVLIALALYKLVFFAWPFIKAGFLSGSFLSNAVSAVVSKTGATTYALAGFNVISLNKKVGHLINPNHEHGHASDEDKEEVETELIDDVKNIAGEIADILA